MQGRISKWGNSLALRLPKTLAGEARLFEGAAVELSVENDSLVVRPARPKYALGYLLAREAAAQSATKSAAESAEVDWGAARGKEEW